jgi:perosamine synthetase
MINLPTRFSYGENEHKAVNSVLEYYKNKNEDPGYQGYFEEKFCDEFSHFMGGGYTDAVATGTASIFVALQSLQLPKGSDVLISPVTDSGPLNCIILLGLNPVVIDSAPNSYNIDNNQFLKKITNETSALLLVHTGGEPVNDTEIIVKNAHEKGIKVLEDCSQATGAVINGKRVGTFGDIAAFSTMYRKNLIAGSSGGLVFTRNKDLYHLVLAYADRGKQTWRTDLNQNDPSFALFPALNFNTDEISSAIGSSSLARLQETIDNRVKFLEYFIQQLNKKSKVCKPYNFNKNFSPFFFPIFVDTTKIKCSKIEFAQELSKNGVGNNNHYGCVISEWNWAHKYLQNGLDTPHALAVKNNSFNLFLNENYTKKDADNIIEILIQIETTYKKPSYKR